MQSHGYCCCLRLRFGNWIYSPSKYNECFSIVYNTIEGVGVGGQGVWGGVDGCMGMRLDVCVRFSGINLNFKMLIH